MQAMACERGCVPTSGWVWCVGGSTGYEVWWVRASSEGDVAADGACKTLHCRLLQGDCKTRVGFTRRVYAQQ